MKPGKGSLANHCSNLEYRGTFMLLRLENSVIAPERRVPPRRCFHPLGAGLVPKGSRFWGGWMGVKGAFWDQGPEILLTISRCRGGGKRSLTNSQ